MKKASLLFALLCVSTLIFAQTETQTATLKHGDNITAYYGNRALIEAEAAAEEGDIITLSSGTFQPTEITKAIILRGAGCETDSETLTPLTDISGKTIFNVETESHSMTIEGIYFNEIQVKKLYSPIVIRCNIRYITSDYGERLVDAHFINCRFQTFRTYGSKNTLFDNCIIWDIYYNGDFGAAETVTAYNSYLKLSCSFNRMILHNCIIVSENQTMNIGNNGFSAAYNCVNICSEGSVFACPAFDCWENKTFTDLFATFQGDNSDWTHERLLLTEAAAAQYLGEDGTEVGIHGGTLPYASRPTYMVPNKTTADHQTTPDGKLNVHIDVIFENK